LKKNLNGLFGINIEICFFIKKLFRKFKMGCSNSQSDYLSEYESKREELKSKYYSNLLNSIQPSNLNAEYVPMRKQPNGNDSGKSKIDQNKSSTLNAEYEPMRKQPNGNDSGKCKIDQNKSSRKY
jgi:hypothetical protein